MLDEVSGFSGVSSQNRYSRGMVAQDAKYRRDRCMSCNAKPVYEILWAEGMGHAWFCAKHAKEWVRKSLADCKKDGYRGDCELNSMKKVDNGEASKKYSDNKQPNILSKFLSEIRHSHNPINVSDEYLAHSQSLDYDERTLLDVYYESEEELAPVRPSGTEEGEEISLEELLPYFKSFYIAKPYVSLVGGLMNKGTTKNDIDIFIRSKTEDRATEFRILRMLPLEYSSRVHFLYPKEEDDKYGVYTNHIDLFDVKLERRTSKKLELMSASTKVELFKFRKLLKPAHGRYKGEVYTMENLIDIVNSKPEWYEKGIYVQKKFDGVHVRCDVKRHYESGFDIKIWTEEGNEISVKLPTLCKALGEASKGHKIVLVGELEFWKDKKHQSRQETAAIIHKKEVPPEEKNVVFNFFDILFYDGDIHIEPYSKRLEYLKKIEPSSIVKNVETRKVENKVDLKNAVKRFAEAPGSEGAYIKRADFPYELDGKTQLNYKYKNTFSIEAEVQDIHKVEGSETWNYLCSIRAKDRDVPIGRTYNTNIKLKEGDIVKVEFVTLNKYFDVKLKKTWYNWWSPRVIMARGDKKRPDNVDTADRLVIASHGEAKNRRASVVLDADPYMMMPDEEKKTLGMAHVHGRGKSIHIDLLFQVSKDWGVGWTLYISAGLSKVAESFNEFKKLVNIEIMPLIKEKLSDPQQKFNCGTKEVKPVEWLDFQGMVGKGEKGATKNEPGFFYIIDRFDVDFGAQKPHYHEYFCHGNIFKGKFDVRLLENKASWKKTGEGLMTWMASIAVTDKTPYVLSRRAVDKKWIPPFAHSCLPAKIKTKVPKVDQYWLSRDPKKRLEIRDVLVEKIKKRRIVLDTFGPAMYRVLRQTFKKQTVIREGPARTRYFFVVCQDKKEKFALALLENPLENDNLTGIRVKQGKQLCGYTGAENKVEPGTQLNQTKATPSNMEVLKLGKVIVMSNTNVKRFRIKDGTMEGEWISYNQEEGTAMWVLKKDEVG